MIHKSTRIAIAALLHDLGKLAERAGIETTQERLEVHKQLYCPQHKDFTDARGWFSHIHAAYTGIAWDALESTGHFPDLRRASPPFADGGDDITDSAVNAASAHHRPDTFLRWIVATADRVASGFERDVFEDYNRQKEDNHYRARLLTLFEQIDKKMPTQREQFAWRYPLGELSPQNIFPQPANDCTPADDKTARAQYKLLWQALLEGLCRIPRSHVANLPLWLDHFDSLWLNITHAIPAATAFGVKPEVSLYDHSKATAALAAALWRWHHETGTENIAAVRQGWDEKKILLVQGDFFGIQDFIFAEGGQTQRHAHKLLRGRSFQVSLLAECAALKLLEALELPSTSQIINAAGKFLIVAPNTESARAAIKRCGKELNDWCLAHTYGEIGVGLASTPASCNDFTGKHFKDLTQRLFAALDTAKHRRFDLCGDTPAVFENFLDSFDNTLGVCAINGRYPAQTTRADYALSYLADDQIHIGEALTKRARLIVAREADTLPVLKLDYFGYRLAFAPAEDVSGKYGNLANRGVLRRVWDFDAPEADGSLWRGYARRFVNGHVARFTESDQQSSEKYAQWANEIELDREHPIKTLHHIACEDRRLGANNRWQGKTALLTLKGDIDNLGALFQSGLETPTFAKMASLSRQMNAFFALWLPWFCEYGKNSHGITRYRNTYTVFAGGDDFFLIGPWESTLALAGEMRQHFADYVVNQGITFSAGMVMTPPKTPVRHLAHVAEMALHAAKNVPGKNAASLWGHSIPWGDWQVLMQDRLHALEHLIERAEQHQADFSTGLTYTLLQLADRSESTKTEDAIWRSQLHYRLARFFRDRIQGNEEKKALREKLLADAIAEIGNALNHYRGAYRLPLSILLYRERD